MNKNNLDSVIDFFFLKNIIIVLLLIAFNCNISSQKKVTQIKKANTSVKKQNPSLSVVCLFLVRRSVFSLRRVGRKAPAFHIIFEYG